MVSQRKNHAGSGAAVKDDIYLIHISESIEKIESYISGMDAATLLAYLMMDSKNTEAGI